MVSARQSTDKQMRYRHKVSAIMRMAAYLMSKGFAPGDLLRSLNLPPSLLFDPSLWVERRISFDLFNAISKCTGDALAGLHIGELLKFEDYGTFGVDILRSPTLLDGLRVAQCQAHQVETGIRVGLVFDREAPGPAAAAVRS